VKGCAFAGIGSPLELDPFSETNYVVSLGGVINIASAVPNAKYMLKLT